MTLATRESLFQSILVFLGLLLTPVICFPALATFHQTATNGSGFVSGLFMLIKTLLTFKHAITFVTGHSRHFGIVGRVPTTIVQIRALMMLPTVVGFLTTLATVIRCEKSGHFGNHVVVVVVHVEVNLLFFVWTSVDDFIVVFFGHDVNFVIA